MDTTIAHWWLANIGFAKRLSLFCITKQILYVDRRASFSDRSHYDDVRMGAIASQITSLTIVYSTVYLDADQRKHQSSASLAFVWGIHRDRWIPRTKGQLRGKCFHLMTSSWIPQSLGGIRKCSGFISDANICMAKHTVSVLRVLII